MKKLAALMALIMLFAFSAAFAEGIPDAETNADAAPIDTITAENNRRFASVLSAKSMRDTSVEKFANDNLGQLLEFDGYVYECEETWHTKGKYDLTVCAGDPENHKSTDKKFTFEEVTADMFGLGKGKLTDRVKTGSSVHVIGRIADYDWAGESIMLTPYLLEKRIPLLEGLDTSLYTELKKGSKGDAVKALQQRLIDLKYLGGKADGSYGNKTQLAIEKFQRKCDLDITGIADPAAQAILMSDNAPENTLSISCSSIVMGGHGQTVWNVDGQTFKLTGNKTKTLKTLWGTYKFNARGEYIELDD